MTESTQDKRFKQAPIPKNLDSLLNEKQKASIDELENMGWRLWFVRRPKFQPVIPVLHDTKHDAIALIDERGNVLEESIIQVRSS